MEFTAPRQAEPQVQARGIFGFGLTKVYQGRKVVDDAEFYITPGEVVGILGPNGAGKTTLFSIIMGQVRPDLGHVFIDDFEVTQLPMYQRARLGLGYLPQETSIFRGLTTEQNIESVLEYFEPDRKQRQEELDRILAEFHLEKVRHSPSMALSGGERRRLEIARATASRPSYLLLDEPFAGVDPIAVSDIRSMINYLCSRGIAILITDHNVRETLGSVHRAYIIYAGQILLEGTPEQIYASPKVRELYLGEDFRP